MAALRIKLSWRSSSKSTRIGFLPSPLAISIGSSRMVLSLLVFLGLGLQPHRSGQLRQPAEQGHAAPPLLVIKCRRAADHPARFNIAMCAALRGYDHSVSQLAVS